MPFFNGLLHPCFPLFWEDSPLRNIFPVTSVFSDLSVFLGSMAAVNPPASGKSFAQALSGSVSGDSFLTQLPPKVIVGDSVRVKISQASYESGLAACQCNLHGRLTLHKGDSPLTTQALKVKLSILWPNLNNWNLIPLGKGFFEFNFGTIEDMRQVWALGVVNLKPGFMRFSCWTKDFIPKAQAQTHAQVWVRLMHLPQEYWGKQTIFEIASGLGSPLTIDEATRNRRFGLFARVLIDVYLASKMFESVIIEREGHALSIVVQYEKYPLYCAHCRNLGHSIHSCSKMNHEAPAKISKKAHNVNTKAQSKAHMNNKQVEEAIVHNIAQSGNEAVGKKSAKNQAQSNNMDPLNNSDTVVEGGEDLFVKVTKKTDNTSLASSAIVTNQKVGNPTKLPVSNSFELLENDSELFSREARPADMEITHITVDKVIPISLNVEDTSLEKEHLFHPPFLKVPRDPNFDEHLVLQPRITPITTTDER